MTSLHSVHIFAKLISHAANQLVQKTSHILFGMYFWMLLCLIGLPTYAMILFSAQLTQRRRFAHSAARLLLRCARIRLTCDGLEKIPDVPHLLIVNHTSFADPIILTAALPAQLGYAFTARQQFSAQKIFCPLLHALGAIILHPHNARHSSNIDFFIDALKRRENILVFPEGGFRPEPGLNSFHPGAFVAATKTNSPVVIAALRGTASLAVGYLATTASAD